MKFKFLPHTADVKFQAFGNSLEEAFGNAFLALKETMHDKIKIACKIKKEIKVKGKDLESLLYNFLEEFLYLLDAEGFICSNISEIKINSRKFVLEAVVFGDKVSSYKTSNDVKAITYNDMIIKKGKNKWMVQVVVDV